MRPGVCILLFLVCAVCICDEPDGLDTIKERLLSSGLSEADAAQLKQLGLKDLRELTVMYLSDEEDPARFDLYLRNMEEWEYGRQLLAGLYPRLFLGVDTPKLRLRLCRSVVETTPEKGEPFLAAELESASEEFKPDILRMFGSYRSEPAFKAVLSYLDASSDTGTAAAEVLGKMGGKEAVPYLIGILRKVGRVKQKKAAAESLREITGYDFGTRHNVWEIWWTKYGKFFEKKRFLRDFRVLNAVEDYKELNREYFTYFFDGIKGKDLASVSDKLSAEAYSGNIIGEPAKYRGVLFSVSGKPVSVETVPEAGCYIVTLTMSTYPFCQIICEGTPPLVKPEVYNAVFYKLRGDSANRKPVMVFVGAADAPAGKPEKEEAVLLIRTCALGKPAEQKEARRKLLDKGKSSVPALKEAVNGESDPVCRATALLILADIDPGEAFPLIEASLTSSEPLLRSSAELILEKLLQEKGENKAETSGSQSDKN